MPLTDKEHALNEYTHYNVLNEYAQSVHLSEHTH